MAKKASYENTGLVRAQAKWVRSSPQKARIVLEHIRGKPVGEARAALLYSPRAVARDVELVLRSAVHNAEVNHGLSAEELADFGDHAADVLVLAVGEPAPVVREAQIETELGERRIGVGEALASRCSATGLGFGEVLREVERGAEQAGRDGGAEGAGEGFAFGDKPGEKVEGAGENDEVFHYGLLR